MMTSERSFAIDKRIARMRDCLNRCRASPRISRKPETYPSGTGGRSDLCGDRSDKTVDKEHAWGASPDRFQCPRNPLRAGSW